MQACWCDPKLTRRSPALASNVVDSLLFVFGFRSNKLRLSKLSELIHQRYARCAPKPPHCGHG